VGKLIIAQTVLKATFCFKVLVWNNALVKHSWIIENAKIAVKIVWNVKGIQVTVQCALKNCFCIIINVLRNVLKI
jgi:hypothetical protein